MKKSIVLFSVLLNLTFASGAFAAGEAYLAAFAPYPQGQQELIAAQEARRRVMYIEVQDAIVENDQMPDDTRGLPHQHWTVKLANGKIVEGVYNIRGVPKLPIRHGEKISMGGEYIPDRNGGLMHWLHEDTRNRRPDGYVEINGVRYGAATRSGIYN